MKHLHLIILCLVAMSVKAQRLSHDFQDTSLSEALIWIDNAQDGYKLNFIFDELEDFTVTTQLKNVSVRDAVRQVCGFYPMHLTFDAQDIYIECMQKSDTKLSGRITNESGQPVAYVSISLLSLSDSTFLTGGVSNEAGDFVIPCKEPKVIARITCIGYKTIEKTLSIGPVGEIRLQADKYTLQGVTVKGSKRLVYATERGLVANVQGTPLAQMGTATDMLSHLPLMMSDGTIAGHGKPEIYINNKKVRDEEELQRLRADEILSAEIITNPGAEYGTEVRSVIRLKTVRKSGEGWSGNFSGTYRQGEKPFARLNASLNYRLRNGMDFFAKGSIAEANNLMTYPGQIELAASNTWNYDLHTKWHVHQAFYNMDLGWNWDINERHSVGFTYTGFGGIGAWDTTIEEDERVWRDGTLVDDEQTSTKETYRPKMRHSVNAYYVGEIGKWKLDFSADYYRSKGSNQMEGLTNGQPYAASTNAAKNELLAEKLTVTAPVPKGHLTFGEEVSGVDRTSDFRQNGFSADNQAHQKTTIWALYANYNLQVGKFSFNAGMRWQNEHNHYEQNGQQRDDMSPDYHVVVPKASASYQNGPWTHTLSYQAERNNPPYEILGGDITYAGKYEYRTGNPFLPPQTGNALSWESQWRWLHMQLQYSHIKNRYDDFHSAYDDTGHPGVMLMDFRAIPSIKQYGLVVNASPKIGPWQLNYTAMAYKEDYDMEAIGITHSFGKLCLDFSLDNTFELSHAWLLNVQGDLTPRQETGYNIIRPHGSLNLRLSKQFLKDKSLSVALVARDILHTSNINVTQYNGIGYRTDINVYRDQRRVGLDLSWKFNATKSRYKGSHAGESERNRL